MNVAKLTWDDFVSWWKLTFRQDIPAADIAAWRLLTESHGVLIVQGSIKPGTMPKPKQVQRILQKAVPTEAKSQDNAYLKTHMMTTEERAQVDAEWDRCEQALNAILADANQVALFSAYLDASSMSQYFRRVWPVGGQPDTGNRFLLTAARQWYFGGDISAI